MDAKETVHKPNGSRRIARGIRMAADTWEFVDGLAEAMTDGNTSALIEKWAREKMKAVRSVA